MRKSGPAIGRHGLRPAAAFRPSKRWLGTTSETGKSSCPGSSALSQGLFRPRFLVAITFVDFENERRHFHGGMSPWCSDPTPGAPTDTPSL